MKRKKKLSFIIQLEICLTPGSNSLNSCNGKFPRLLNAQAISFFFEFKTQKLRMTLHFDVWGNMVMVFDNVFMTIFFLLFDFFCFN